MCGIAGIYDLTGAARVTRAELEAMIAVVPHRGPDAQGASVLADGVGFGHVRLAILDLVPESNQPFAIDDGAYVITYNGEIFNYVELRRELEALGHRFRTQSDTEVLLRAYAAWGADAVPRLNGMWAFVIYDRRRDEIFASRDRFGIKPLCYTEHGERLLFASEIKSLLVAAPELAAPNWTSLSMLLRASIGAHREETCFDGVRRLPPAHSMTVSRRDGIRIERYWDYPVDTDDLDMDEAAAGLRERLVDSLRLRMRSDVPVGTTLSGGVDSSSIVCLLRTFHDEPHETFTARFPGDRTDESVAAERLTRSLGMNANAVPALAGEFLPTLRRLVYHLESPHHSPAIMPLWNIMEVERRKVTVVLEGQGADELLAGYLRQCLPAVVRDRLRAGRPDLAWSEFRWQCRNLGSATILARFVRLLAPWSHDVFRWIRGDERVYTGPLRGAPARPPTLRDEPAIRDPLNASLRRQHETALVDLLHYGDAISMAHSIESRLPFMDHRLVEYCFRMPGRLKYTDGHGKAVLKRAMRDDVPAAILAPRTKLGFETPFARWFREHPEKTVDPVLRSDACRERGIFDPVRLDDALARHRSGRFDLSNNILRWITTELWFQAFIDRAPAAEPAIEVASTA